MDGYHRRFHRHAADRAGGDGLVNQFCGARLAVQEPQGIHVRHATGDPRVDVLGQIRIAGIVQPVGATLRGGEMCPKCRSSLVSASSRAWFSSEPNT